MSDQSELLAAIATMMDEKIAAALPAIEAAPVAATTKASGTTKAKAVVKRQLDPIEVAGSGDVGFRVVAHTSTGAMYTKGARVVPMVDDKTYRSLDENMLVALAEDGVLDKLVAAIATVNKRALLGEHAPAKVSAAS